MIDMLENRDSINTYMYFIIATSQSKLSQLP